MQTIQFIMSKVFVFMQLKVKNSSISDNSILHKYAV